MDVLRECQDHGLLEYQSDLGAIGGGGVRLTVTLIGSNGYELWDSAGTFEETAKLFWSSPTGVNF